MVRFKDITGKKFGHLFVLNRVANDKWGATRWLCQCDCGGKVDVSSACLTRGDTRSCGCLRKTIIFHNLVDKKFGRFIVLSQVVNGKQGQSRWLCKCDCGKLREVRGSSLESGDSQSCGCLQKEIVSKIIGSLRPNWNGGRTMRKGYVVVLDRTSIHANSEGYALEHLIIMDKMLGRPVDTKTESVHHKNGIKSDNRPENLELRIKQQHPLGQSIEDVVKDAKEFLTKYKPEFLSLKCVN